MSHEMEIFLFKNHYPTSVSRSLFSDDTYSGDTFTVNSNDPLLMLDSDS